MLVIDATHLDAITEQLVALLRTATDQDGLKVMRPSADIGRARATLLGTLMAMTGEHFRAGDQVEFPGFKINGDPKFRNFRRMQNGSPK